MSTWVSTRNLFLGESSLSRQREIYFSARVLSLANEKFISRREFSLSPTGNLFLGESSLSPTGNFFSVRILSRPPPISHNRNFATLALCPSLSLSSTIGGLHDLGWTLGWTLWTLAKWQPVAASCSTARGCEFYTIWDGHYGRKNQKVPLILQIIGDFSKLVSIVSIVSISAHGGPSVEKERKKREKERKRAAARGKRAAALASC